MTVTQPQSVTAPACPCAMQLTFSHWALERRCKKQSKQLPWGLAVLRSGAPVRSRPGSVNA